MSEKHYAPKTPVYVVDDIDEEVLKIPHREIGVITYDSYSGLLPVSQQLIIGNLSNPQLIASNIYAAMHDMDKRSFQRILVKKLPEGGIGTAINDRLRRAAKNHK
jgi:L-threonylcarbamoyladenylate synthase